jgi:hypothetical protein
MPTNNKKSKGRKVVAKTAITNNRQTSINAASLPHSPASRKLQQHAFSKAQLASLMLLSQGVSNLLVDAKVLASENNDKACSHYLNNEEACTSDDVTLIRAKYYGSVICLTLMFISTIICWNDEPVLTRLTSFLCISPLGTTLLALSYNYDVIVHGGSAAFRLFATNLALLVLIGASYLTTVSVARPIIKSRITSVQNMTILTLLGVLLRDSAMLLQEGPDGFIVLSSADGGVAASTAATILTHFIALDKVTIALLFVFVALFFDDGRKRVRELEHVLWCGVHVVSERRIFGLLHVARL